jgi:pimeloyl-ACP methyl ester carboxylesterase
MLEQRTIDGLTVLTRRGNQSGHAPLLFIHGYFAGAWVFGDLMEYFASHGHSSCAVNLRGRGGSRLGTDVGRVSMNELIDDARTVARTVAREHGPPIAIGHSMGGLIAQKLAESGEAAGAVLLAPAPPRGIFVLTAGAMLRQLRHLPSILFSRAVVPRFSELRALVLNRVPPADQRRLFRQFVPDSGRAGREMLLGRVTVDARRVTCPLLVIAGDHDRYIPLASARRVAEKYGARLHVVPGRAHMLLQEPGWQQVAAMITAWQRSG